MLNNNLDMIKNLTFEERKILELFFNIPFPYIDALYQQLCVAKFEREDCGSSYFLDFLINEAVPFVPISVSVPIVVDLCSNLKHLHSEDKKIEFYENHTFHVLEPCKSEWSPSDAETYIEILLHFKQPGVVKTLELVNACGFLIDHQKMLLNLSNGIKVYRYADSKLYAQIISQIGIE